MTKETQNPNDERGSVPFGLRTSPFFHRSTFVFCASSFVIGLTLIGLAAKSPAQTTSTENNVKAVYLFHFAQFVDWPTNAFPNAQAPMVIGVLGRDYLSRSIEEAVSGEVAHGRKLAVKRCVDVDDAKTCHILFISRSEADRLERILSRLEGKSILTVSDIEGFTTRGGMIRFITERNHIKFRINNPAAEKAGLTISSKLLRLAEGNRTGAAPSTGKTSSTRLRDAYVALSAKASVPPEPK